MHQQSQLELEEKVTQSGDRYKAAAKYVELDRTHRKRGRWSALLIISLLVLAVSLVTIGVIGYSYYEGQQKYARLSESASTDVADQSFDEMTVDWDALRAINPDVVAWVYIPGTSINYPVAQSSDNDFYLTHDFELEQGWLAMYGSIFMDYLNNPDWSDDAYFMYGHHMNDGSMFADIAGLRDQEWFDSCRTVYLLSPNGNFKLRTLSLIHCSPYDPIVQVRFPDPEDMTAYTQDKIDRSIVYASEIPPAWAIGKLFAFSTCDNYSSGRYVLYAYIEDSAGVNVAGASSIVMKDGYPIGLSKG